MKRKVCLAILCLAAALGMAGCATPSNPGASPATAMPAFAATAAPAAMAPVVAEATATPCDTGNTQVAACAVPGLGGAAGLTLTQVATATAAVTATATAAITATSTITAGGAMTPGRSVTIWAPYFTVLEQQTLEQYADVIDEVNFVWYHLQGDGAIEGAVQSAEGLAAARKLGLRVVPTIANSGFNRDVVLQAIGSPEARAKHIAKLVALVQDNGFDGLDIDYESLEEADREVFTTFIEELAAALHAQGKLLSIAVHAKTTDAGTWGGPAAQDWQRLGAAVDEFKIMTYDKHWSTSEAGPIAPTDWVDEVLTYAATVVPPEKIYMGVHFYGYDWVGKVAQDLDWQQAQKRIAGNDAQVQRDPSGEAWFTYDAGRHTVYFADAQSVQAKLAAIFARHPRLAGIAIWRLGNEDPEVWPTIRKSTMQ